jgi:hypothetical protein
MNPVHPYAWEPHLAAWAVLWLAALAIVVGHRHVRRRNEEATPWTPRQMLALAGAGAAAAVALTWPLADLADVERQLERAARRSERNAKHDRDPTSPPPDDTDQ